MEKTNNAGSSTTSAAKRIEEQSTPGYYRWHYECQGEHAEGENDNKYNAGLTTDIQ